MIRPALPNGREWRGVKDTFYDYTQWLKNLGSMAAMVGSAPIACLKGFWEYRWMGSYLGHIHVY